MPARATPLLVVSASVPASLPSAHAHTYSAVPDANAADKTNADAYAANKTNADPAELDAHASNVHRESSWGSAESDAHLHCGSSVGYAESDSDSAAGGPRDGNSREARTRQVNADSACWNVAARQTNAYPRVHFEGQADSDQDENARESYADPIARHG